MKRLTLIFILLLFSRLNTYSQANLNKDSYSEKRYFAWYSPSKATHTYGLMFNVWPRDDIYTYHNAGYPQIDGIEFNIMPLSIFFPFMLAVNSIIPQKINWDSINVDTINYRAFKKINGVQIGFANLEPSLINGLDINVGRK